MKEIAPFLVIGITSGSVYALAALGLVLNYKTSGVFNFAHGAQAALGAYLMYELRDIQGLPWPVAAVIVIALAGVLVGLILERLGTMLIAVPVAARVAATVGLMVGIQGMLVAIFGGQSLRMQFFLPTHLVEIGGVSIRVEQIIVTVGVLVAAAGLYVFLGRTRLGISMQAVVDDPALLSLDATSPTLVRRYAWVIGSCFAAVSGMLLAPTTGLDANLLTLLVFYAFGAAAVGAFDNLWLTYIGGVGIGLASAVMTKYINSSGAVAALPSTLPFIVLFVVLLVYPKGKLIQRGSEVVRAALPERRFSEGSMRVGGIASAVILLVVPHVVGVRVPLYTTAIGFVMLFLSLNLLVRMSGQISLCQITFAAVGAATFAHVSASGAPWLVAVAAGALIAIPLGAVVAIPAIRLSGVFLAIATFGFGLLVQNLVFPSWLMFGNFSKVLDAPRPKIGGLDLQSDTGYYYVVLAFVAVAAVIVLLARRSRIGRLLGGLAQSPVALDAHGVNTNVVRVIVFCLSASLAATAGAVLAPVTGSVTGVPFNFGVSLLLVAVLFISGRQPIFGSVLGAFLYVVVPGYINDPQISRYVPVLFGAGAILAAGIFGMPLIATWLGSRRTQQRRPRSAARARAVDREGTSIPVVAQ